MEIAVFWFRRDLRLQDNVGLYYALQSPYPILPLFIFDTDIIDHLIEDDARISFIYENLSFIHQSLSKKGSGILIEQGKPFEIWRQLVKKYSVKEVYANNDYEPYSIQRDLVIKGFLNENGILFKMFKDQVIFEKNDVIKADGSPYTIFTPYKNKWLSKLSETTLESVSINLDIANFVPHPSNFPELSEIGFKISNIKVKPFCFEHLEIYDKVRNDPSLDQTSYLSPHLRFGTIGIRDVVSMAQSKNATFLSELIWREFFMQILFHFPRIVTTNFKSKYDKVPWRNNEVEFKAWCEGKTGYPLVDAGMRQLNKTGYMHNRVRMITAGFLCKHLLIDWKWGEAYFATKLLDYELSSNNGNWQWSAGTGCDAAPYFRVFNPNIQLKTYDPSLVYVKRWVEDLNDFSYPKPIVEHSSARTRAINTYKAALE